MNPLRLAAGAYDEVVVADDTQATGPDAGTRPSRSLIISPRMKTRSLSDGGGTPKLSPSPHIVEAARQTSKDDSSIKDSHSPATPLRNSFAPRGLSLQMVPRVSPPTTQSIQPPSAAAAYPKPTPVSPKVDHPQIYASPTSILPRRSRGLDFSRAATSLHHSTLADDPPPDSSPTIGARSAMNIPGRRPSEYGPEQSSASLWSTMGPNERSHISSSLGSINMLASESSSSSDDDDYMDDEMDDIISTPQAVKSSTPICAGPSPCVPWMPGSGSPANSLSFQRPQRRIKQQKKKFRGPLNLGLSAAATLSKSPPSNTFLAKDLPHARRESISWAANQLHISSGNDSDDNKPTLDADGLPSTPSRDGQRNVIRRAVTRRGNLLPKTKTFARIKAELIEEQAPVEAELRRESQVIRQVRESDMDLEPRMSATNTALSSPLLGAADDVPDVPEDEMMTDAASSFKHQAIRNSKGSKIFWDTFSESSSMGGARTTPPPPAFLSRGSTAGFGDDVSMDSPAPTTQFASMSGVATGSSQSDSQQSTTHTPQLPGGGATGIPHQQPGNMIPPTAAEITRRLHSKRRRDDDFDPHSFKRRAVSPGMSVHNSPIMQSPLQRDVAPWGSRPGSNGGERSSAPSESGSLGGGNGNRALKGRVGYQGMVDTNDGIMRMSIE